MEEVYAVELHEVGLTIEKQELLKNISVNFNYGKIMELSEETVPAKHYYLNVFPDLLFQHMEKLT